MLKKKLTVYTYLAQKKLKRQIRKLASKKEVQVIRVSQDYDSHLIDDLPLTLNRDPYPGRIISK